MTTSNSHGYRMLPTSTGERYTPEYIVEAARHTLGSIEFDPASSARANKIIKADRFLGKDDRSLDDDVEWSGLTLLNPPGNCRDENEVLAVCGNPKVCSCGYVPRFWNKLLLSHKIHAAIWIGFALDQLQALQSPLCFPTCVPEARIKYLDANFVKLNSPPHGSYITLVCDTPGYLRRFKESFAPLGQLVGPL